MEEKEKDVHHASPALQHRTYLAWVRTGLAMMGFGFVVARFALFLRDMAVHGGLGIPVSESSPSAWLGIFLVASGVVVQIGAAVRYRRHAAMLAGTTHPQLMGTRPGLGVAVVLTIVGTAATIVLVSQLLE